MALGFQLLRADLFPPRRAAGGAQQDERGGEQDRGKALNHHRAQTASHLKMSTPPPVLSALNKQMALSAGSRLIISRYECQRPVQPPTTNDQRLTSTRRTLQLSAGGVDVTAPRPADKSRNAG